MAYAAPLSRENSTATMRCASHAFFTPSFCRSFASHSVVAPSANDFCCGERVARCPFWTPLGSVDGVHLTKPVHTRLPSPHDFLQVPVIISESFFKFFLQPPQDRAACGAHAERCLQLLVVALAFVAVFATKLLTNNQASTDSVFHTPSPSALLLGDADVWCTLWSEVAQHHSIGMSRTARGRCAAAC